MSASHAEVANDFLKLLELDVTYEGWANGLAKKKCFYVRGITWFRDNVLGSGVGFKGCEKHIPRMKEILASRENWQRRGFDWQEPFALRQLVDAASQNRRRTPKFQKAVESIVLCEAIAEYMHKQDPSRPPKEAVYERMRIEPAVSYVPGFNRSVLDTLLKDEQAVIQLRNHTGHKELTVFYDMADGHTVTHKLADRLYSKVLAPRMNHIQISPATWRYAPRHRKYSPSREEVFDAKIPPEPGSP